MLWQHSADGEIGRNVNMSNIIKFPLRCADFLVENCLYLANCNVHKWEIRFGRFPLRRRFRTEKRGSRILSASANTLPSQPHHNFIWKQCKSKNPANSTQTTRKTVHISRIVQIVQSKYFRLAPLFSLSVINIKATMKPYVSSSRKNRR